MGKLFLYSLLIIVLSSCTLEDEIYMEIGKATRLNVKSRSIDPSVKVRIIVANSSDGKIIFNKYPYNLTENAPILLPAGELNFYIIANEPWRLSNWLNIMPDESALSDMKIVFDDLPGSEVTNSEETVTDIPAVQMIKAEVRGRADNLSVGEVRTRAGGNWEPILNVNLDRVAVKTTIGIRKCTPAAIDSIRIYKIELLNVPHYAGLIPAAYTDNVFDSHTVYENAEGLLFVQNADDSRDDNYVRVVDGFIIPEYLLADSTQKDEAVVMRIHARYNKKPVTYRTVLRGDKDKEDYNLRRNGHYVLLATIVSEGEFIYSPQLDYVVSDWNDANGSYNFIEESAILYSAAWEPGTKYNGLDVWVGNTDSVDFRFTLAYPPGAMWMATLTNPIDFMFDDTDGAISYGVTRPGEPYVIRIRPRRKTVRSGISTAFYITVNNGMRNVELDLPQEQVGGGNRFIIHQVPD